MKMKMTRRRVCVASVVTAGMSALSFVGLDLPPANASSVVGSYFAPTTVERVLDTRSGLGDITATGNPVAGGVFYDLSVPGCPAGTTAIALNITATEASGGFVSVYAGGTRSVSTSLLNPNPGGTRANFTLVPVGPNDTITLYSQRSTHLVADRFGCMVAAPSTGVRQGRFVPNTTRGRAVDTRGTLAPTGRRTAGSVTRITLTTPGFGAAAITVTVDGPSAPGWLAVAPGGTFSFAAPTSNLNFVPGEARAAFVIVPLAADGSIDVAVSQETDVIIDVAGFFTSELGAPTLDGVFVPQQARLLDSRTGSTPAGRVAPGESVAVPLPAFAATPSALFLNYTADDAAAPGFLSGWSGPVWELSSNVNYTPGETSPSSGVTALVAPERDLKVRVGAGAAAVIADLAGYFADLPVAIGASDTASWEADVAAVINAYRASQGRPSLPLVRISTTRACAQVYSRDTVDTWNTSTSSFLDSCVGSLSFVAPPGMSPTVPTATGYGTSPAQVVDNMRAWRNDPAALVADPSEVLEVGCSASFVEPGLGWCTAMLFTPLA